MEQPSMTDSERRKPGPEPFPAMIAGLSDLQRRAARDLLQFGWELRFVRRKPFHTPVMFFFDPERQIFATVEDDGELRENPKVPIRS